jgi:hypothetical protein
LYKGDKNLNSFQKMSWSPTIIELNKFLSVLTDRQYDKMENAILSGKTTVSYSDEERSAMERKLKTKIEAEEKLYKTAELNNAGIEAEKNGNITLAISIYEENIKGESPASHSYDRLLILYRKDKRYDDELRVIKAAKKVFTGIVKNKFQEREQKVLLLKSRGVQR